MADYAHFVDGIARLEKRANGRLLGYFRSNWYGERNLRNKFGCLNVAELSRLFSGCRLRNQVAK